MQCMKERCKDLTLLVKICVNNQKITENKQKYYEKPARSANEK